MIMLMGVMTACSSGNPGTDDTKGDVEIPVTLYFVDSKYIETGDESIEPMVVEQQKLLLEKEEEDDKYEETLELLTKPTTEGMDTMVRPDMIDSVKVDGGMAVVDFDSDSLHGGSLEETYLIEQVVRTLIKSYEEISKVSFTVEGQTVQSLMGHLEADCVYGLITVHDKDKGDVELVSILAENQQ